MLASDVISLGCTVPRRREREQRTQRREVVSLWEEAAGNFSSPLIPSALELGTAMARSGHSSGCNRL